MGMGSTHVLKTVTLDITKTGIVNSATQLVSFIKNTLPDIGILLKMELVGQATTDTQFVKYENDSDWKVTSTRYRTGQGTAAEFAWNSSIISVTVVQGTQYIVQYIPSNVL